MKTKLLLFLAGVLPFTVISQQSIPEESGSLITGQMSIFGDIPSNNMIGSGPELISGDLLTDPSNVRSDTLDILQYTIDLDLTQVFTTGISAHCQIDFMAKMDGIDWISLDLLELTVDSVVSAGTPLNFEYTDELLVVQLPAVLNENEMSVVHVYYHGDPVQDLSWGGFYTTSGYAFNLGVGFDADPHVFGRAWFPCFDNFVERSTYQINVLTSAGKTAYCSGLRTGSESVGQDSLLTHWAIDDEIPSYLASVAAGDYVHSEQVFQSMNGNDIPVWLASKAADSTDFKNSLTNLLAALDGFEARYGPYRFQRVGFTAVPFSGGAMEHATNIAYPLFAIDGGLGYETLYAHELSHMWWGDNTTCRTQEDMWLNEGWASYSESIFLENIYGPEAYLENVRSNHKDVLLHTHITDGAYLAVSGIDHDHTYGSTVYDKGADVAHSLRGYMGDAAFFEGITSFQETFTMSDVSSEDLRDHLQNFTDADLSSFFDNWVFSPGFTEFRVIHSDQNELLIQQNLHYTPELYSSVPLHVRCIASDFSHYDTTVVMTDPLQTVTLNLPEGFVAEWVALNSRDELAEAVLAEEKFIKDNPLDDFNYAEMDIQVENMAGMDSIWMRVENHWAAANDPAFIPNTDYYISPDRCWFVQTNAPEDAQVDATIRYYGNNGSNDYFDPIFFTWMEDQGYTEDSLVLLWRPDGASDWQEFGSYSVNPQGGLTNWTGRIEITDVQQGWYAWAVHTGVVGIPVNQVPGSNLSVLFPSANEVEFRAPEAGTITVFDATGKQIVSATMEGSVRFPCMLWSAGGYLAVFDSKNKHLQTRFILP